MNSTVNKFPILMMIVALTIALAGVTPGVLAQVPPASSSSSAALPQSTVRALQQALNAQGITAPVDGVLGDDTRAAIRTYQSQHHLPVTGEPDAATLGKLGVAVQGDALPADPQTPGQAMGGQGMGQGMMGMMTPEMMQMMQRMMAQRGTGQGMSGGGMGAGMMGGMGGQGMSGGGMGAGRMGGMGQGMPGGGMGAGMMGGMAGQGMPEGGMGQGMMGHAQMPMAGGMMGCPMMQSKGAHGGMNMMGAMAGPGLFYGMPHDATREMTPARVRALLEQRLEQHANPRLKLGEIATAADGNIVAEIVTVDGSLVQKLAFNRYPGLVRQITE